MPRKIKGIFFDLDDTLVLTKDIDVQAYQQVCTLARQIASGLDDKRLIADWRVLFAAEPWDPEHQVEVEAWRAGLWQRAVVQQGLECSHEAAMKLQACFSSTRLQLFQFLPGVEDMIMSLSKQGYSLVVITNGHHLIQRQKVESCRAGSLFQHVLVGGEEILEGRHEKPHPLIFQRACELANCRPDEAIHVGDSLSCDVQGGINAGLAATIWVNADGKPLPEGSPRPDFVVQSVLELPDVLQAVAVMEKVAGASEKSVMEGLVAAAQSAGR